MQFIRIDLEVIFRYIGKRLLLAIPVLLLVSLITYTATYLVPSDPVRIIMADLPPGQQTEEVAAMIRHQLGLDQPFHIQYFYWLSRLFQGDMGYSFMTHRPIANDIRIYFLATFELSTVSLLIALVLGIPIGVISATKRDKITDHIVRLFSLGGVATPTFWLGLMLQLVFYSALGILPIGGRLDSFVYTFTPITRITGLYLVDSLITGNLVALISVLRHLLLPAFVLAYAPIGRIARMTRATMLDTLGQDYVRTARAGGFSERKVVYVHALRNAMIPIVTIVGLIYGRLLAGSVLVETIFDWPGIGRYIVNGIFNLDYPVIVGVSLIFCVVYVTANLITDIAYTALDPRIKT